MRISDWSSDVCAYDLRRVAAPGVRITAIVGDATGADAIPLEVERNTAGQALASLHAALGLAFGFELMLEKGIPIGAGLGGSAASCVAALVAANALLDVPLQREALYPFAIDGEAVSSHSRQGDNRSEERTSELQSLMRI